MMRFRRDGPLVFRLRRLVPKRLRRNTRQAFVCVLESLTLDYLRPGIMLLIQNTSLVSATTAACAATVAAGTAAATSANATSATYVSSSTWTTCAGSSTRRTCVIASLTSG